MNLDSAWTDHRRYVLDVAFRMLGNIAEAEDVVQEAFARLVREGGNEIEDVRGWLVVVVSRLCLDQVRSARWRRVALDPSAGAEVSGAVDPADRITLDDSVRTALLVLLERLSPAERTAFVLHDVFQFSFDDVGPIVGRSPAACRKLASRARRQIQSQTGPARFMVESADERRVTDQFIAACASGDLDGLLAVLDPDVAGQADLGGTVGLGPVVAGSRDVARRTLVFFGPQTNTTLVSMPVNGEPGIIAFRGGRVVAVILLTVRDGLVEHIHSIADPVKLEPVTALLVRT